MKTEGIQTIHYGQPPKGSVLFSQSYCTLSQVELHTVTNSHQATVVCLFLFRMSSSLTKLNRKMMMFYILVLEKYLKYKGWASHCDCSHNKSDSLHLSQIHNQALRALCGQVECLYTAAAASLRIFSLCLCSRLWCSQPFVILCESHRSWQLLPLWYFPDWFTFQENWREIEEPFLLFFFALSFSWWNRWWWMVDFSISALLLCLFLGKLCFKSSNYCLE